ncbi:transcription cofactor vestigial-like protein 3 isoform X2 [Heterodontus francisci]|uniref:transcription cofactor vestigial-like protein 3 isoform X2 n=1 Tax=Heterodontus francisci TaxID=7792 RepID=UPI00355B4BD3
MSSFSIEDRQGSTHMEEEPERISQQQKVGKSEREGMSARISTVRVHETESSSRCMIFTYFKGDINSMVDEHFTRALKRSSSPIDVCSKRKTESIEAKTDEKQPTHRWSPRAQFWSSPYQGPILSTVTRNAASEPVAQYRPGSHQNPPTQPHNPWLLPVMSSQSLDGTVCRQPMPELHRMMPAAINNRQYSSLLHGERPATGPSQPQAIPKPNITSTWAGPEPGLADMGQSMNSDIGFQHQQRRKDLYWY